MNGQGQGGGPGGGQARRAGRPATVQRDQVAAAGLALFLKRGFDAATMTEVAEAAGVGRKTLFTYFPTKADLVWNRFNRQLARLELRLSEGRPELPAGQAVAEAIEGGIDISPEDLPILRAELQLIRAHASLEAYAHVAGRPWRQAITRYLSQRSGLPEDHVLPITIGHGFWEAMFVGLNQWLDGAERTPTRSLRAALRIYAGAVEQALIPRSTRKG